MGNWFSGRETSGSANVDSSKAPPRHTLRAVVRIVIAIVAIGAGAVAILAYSHRKRSDKPAGYSATAAASPIGVAPVSDHSLYATYAGSTSCRDCHRDVYDRWSQSHHGLAERPVRPELDQRAFDPPRRLQFGSQPVEVSSHGGTFQIASKDLSGSVAPQTVERVIGVDPLRQFLVPFPGGRFQAMEAAYDPNHNAWFDVYGNEDRQPGEWGHWTGRGMNWNSMCAACHNTRLRKNYDESSDFYHTAMAEPSVSCESCHGPMKGHVDWARTYSAGKTATKDPHVPHFSRDQMLDTCGSCHARRADLTGDFAPGDSFFDHYMLNGVDASDTFYPDGQVRDEDYEFSAFLGSRMYAAGVRCVDCHDPHSGKTLLTGNALCMRCHVGAYPKAPIIDPATHTFHKLDSAGSQCINCHMPITTYMQRHGRHDHGFTTPDPLLTRELGIPNACNRCHTDKDASWALAAAERWYGAKLDRPSRRRTRTIAAARRGDESARAGLLTILNDANQSPYWKAASASLLSAWAVEPTAHAALLQHLSAADPLVRTASARKLAPLASQDAVVADALQRSLADRSRGVRIAAAQALPNVVDPHSPVALEFARFLAQQADQPTGQLQQAMYLISRGQDAHDAISHLQKAVAWDARSAAMRREVALAYSTLSRPADAAAQLEQACRLDPNNADDEYLLGLAYSELGRPDQTAAALARAVQLNPRHARAWYNLGLARRNLGQTEAALDAIRQAESIDPNEPQYPYARATILAQAGRREEARAAAQRALTIRPDDPKARQLLNALDNP